MAKNIEVTLTLDNKQYNNAIKQSKAQTKDFETSSVSSSGRIAAAFAAIGGTAVLRSITNIGGTFEDIRNSLNVVFGSIDEGARQFERIQDFAAGTQFSVQTLTQAFVQLKGAGVEPTEELLMTFANTASVTTDQMGTFQAALDLVTRSTAGGLGLEDLNRLADRGIPVFTILQDKLGLTRLEISEFGKTADGANQIISALTDELNVRFGGALDDSSNNLSRLTNNLGDAFDSLADSIFQLFSDELKAGITGLTTIIQDLTASINALNEAGVKLGDILAVVGGVIVFILNPLGKLRVAFSAVKKAGGSVIAAFTGLGNRAKMTIPQIDSMIKLFDRLASTFGFAAVLQFMKVFGNDTEEVTQQVDGMTGAMKRNAEAQKEFEERQAAAKRRAEALKQEIKDLTKAANGFAKNDYRTELEKITDRQDFARQALFDLRMAFVKANGEIENYANLLAAVKNEISAADQAFKDYNDKLKDPAPETYAEFVKRLDTELLNYNTQQENARKLLEEMNKAFEKSPESVENFAFIIERLNDILGISNDELSEGQKAFKDFTDSIGEVDTIEEYVKLNEQLQALIEKYPTLFEEAADAKDELDEALKENEGLANFLETLGQAQVALSKDLATSLVEGKSAAEAFQSFFKKLVVQLIADALRLAIIQPILGSLFGVTFGAGGAISGLTGGGLLGIFGKKELGGPVMKNRPYIVGERGPELFVPGATGNIVRNDALGATNVYYNIQAVDAPSFQQLVARDPEFIYAVTQAGRRRVPR